MEGEEDWGLRDTSSVTSRLTSSVTDSDGSSVLLAPPDWTRLILLPTRDASRRFLRAILGQFVETVEVDKPGLLEELMAARVVCGRDAESLDASHLPTPSEKARRLWDILCHIDHSKFVRKALPALCRHYWYIIPQQFWLPADAPPTHYPPPQFGPGSDASGGSPYCTRCAIRRRIRPPDLADLLTSMGLISSRMHSDISSSYRNSTTDWAKIFRAFKKLAGHDVSSHVNRMRKLMARHSLLVPEDLSQLMVQGFPCRCASGKKSGLCLPTLACISPSSSTESGLPSLPSLSCISDNEAFDSNTSLSLPSPSPSPSSHSHDSSSDCRQLSDYHQTTLKEVASVSAHNSSSPSPIMKSSSPVSGDVSLNVEESAREESERRKVEERVFEDTGDGSVREWEEQSRARLADRDEEDTLVKLVWQPAYTEDVDETVPKTIALRHGGREGPHSSQLAADHQSREADKLLGTETSEEENQCLETDTHRKPSLTDEETLNGHKGALLSNNAFRSVFPLSPGQLPVVATAEEEAQTTPSPALSGQQAAVTTGVTSSGTQTEVQQAENKAASVLPWEENKSDLNSRNVSWATLIHSSTLSVPGTCVHPNPRRRRGRGRGQYTRWELYLARYSTCAKSVLVLGACLLGLVLLALVLSPFALIKIGMNTDNYLYAIAGCVVHVALVAGFFIVTRKRGGEEDLKCV